MLARPEPNRRRRLAALCLEGDRLSLAVGRARDQFLDTVDFIEETPSVGLDRGMIVDTELFTDALDHLAQTLEQITRAQGMDRIVCGVHGPFVHIQLLTRAFRIPGGGPLSPAEVRAMVRDLALKAADDRALLHVMPWRYVIDDLRESVSPKGLRGDRLRIEALGAFADRSPLEDVTDVLDELGLGGSEIVVTPLAAARFVLSDAERREGVVWVDFAWDETRVSVYRKRRLYLYRTIEGGVSRLVTRMARHVPDVPSELRRHVRKVDVVDSPDASPGGEARAFLRAELEEARAFVEESRASAMSGARPPTWVLSGALADARAVEEAAARVVTGPVRVASLPESLRMREHEDSASTILVGLLAAAAREPAFSPPGVTSRAWTRLWHVPRRILRRFRPLERAET